MSMNPEVLAQNAQVPVPLALRELFALVASMDT